MQRTKEETGGSFKVIKGRPVIGNIHAHPDKRNNGADGAFHTMRGESSTDYNTAISYSMPVNSIEAKNVYYYSPYSNSVGNVQRYSGGKDAASIIRHAVNLKIHGK